MQHRTRGNHGCARAVRLDVAATLGSTQTLLALGATVIVWMSFERRWRTVTYWVVAVAFSQLLVAAIRFTAHEPALVSFAPSEHRFPNSDVAATVVIYGFLAFLLLRRVGILTGVFIATATSAIVTAVGLAGLYFGRFTISDAHGPGHSVQSMTVTHSRAATGPRTEGISHQSGFIKV